MIEKMRQLLKAFKRNTRCKVCGRPLYSARSKQIGVGPTCRHGNKHIREFKDLEQQGQMAFNLDGGGNDRRG